MRLTRKLIESHRRALEPYIETGDWIGAHMANVAIQRDLDQWGDVFGNLCRCRMNDDGEWVAAFCPEHSDWPEWTR